MFTEARLEGKTLVVSLGHDQYRGEFTECYVPLYNERGKIIKVPALLTGAGARVVSRDATGQTVAVQGSKSGQKKRLYRKLKRLLGF